MNGSTFNSSDPVPAGRMIATATKEQLTHEQRAGIMRSLEPREVALPVRKRIAPEPRSSIVNDLEPREFVRQFQQTRQADWIGLVENGNKAQAGKMQKNVVLNSVFDDAQATAATLREDFSPLRPREKILRTKNTKALTVTLTNLVNMIRQRNKDNKRAHYANPIPLRNSEADVNAFVNDKLIHLDAKRLAKVWEAKIWRRTYEMDWDLDNYVDQMETDIMDLELWEAHFDSELDGYDIFREHFWRYFGGEKDVWLQDVGDADKA
jgi:hypothetical protein